MALGSTDLNLLLPLKVLLEEGSVTRAGRRLDVGQPAMSAALARLRRRFDDELLVRNGREYELTPLAKDLLPEVQRAVRLISCALDLEDEFDPARSRRTFRLTMSDYAIAVVHEPLVRLVEAEAPGVRLDISHLEAHAAFSDRILVDNDVLIVPTGHGFPGMSRPVWTDRLVVIADRGNPRLSDGCLSLDDLAALPHAISSYGPGAVTADERIFGELRIERRVALQVHGYLPLPFVIEGTEMVAVVPERLACMLIRPSSRLVTVEPPFGQVLLTENYWFAEDRLADPAHRWLFGRLDAVRDELAATGTVRADLAQARGAA
ncbi:LysR family transcriptional regulator [Streptomyces sp. NPDC013157]|uniref:LysR family transcriptional regulator n=1 Tax=Streptomyces sp. NPDC013157 TaxID=3364861 RepID=UPI0036AF504B